MATILRAQGAAQRVSACARIGTTRVRARHAQAMLGFPGTRLPALAQLIRELKGTRVVRIMETHNGLTGLIVESASARRIDTGEKVSFDGMWSSSLTASSAQGKPDIETVDTTVSMHTCLLPGSHPVTDRHGLFWSLIFFKIRSTMCATLCNGMTLQNDDRTQSGIEIRLTSGLGHWPFAYTLTIRHFVTYTVSCATHLHCSVRGKHCASVFSDNVDAHTLTHRAQTKPRHRNPTRVYSQTWLLHRHGSHWCVRLWK